MWKDAKTQMQFSWCEGEVEKHYKDYEDALGEGTFSLSNPGIWGITEGKRVSELELTDRLFYQHLEQSLGPEKLMRMELL